MADEKQMNAIRFFCEKPYSDHGLKQRMGKGRDFHDWSDLIQQISYFDFGHIQTDTALVQSVARLVRKEFPSGQEWNKSVKVAGAHEKSWQRFAAGSLVGYQPRNFRKMIALNRPSLKIKLRLGVGKCSHKIRWPHVCEE